MLTMGRIVVILPIVATFFVEDPTARWVALWLYTLACVTDFFDGWLARRSNLISDFGRFLDPIADKLLIATLILMLAAFDRFSLWSAVPAAVIICREILVSGLREFLAGAKVKMPVTLLAKWKTTSQMFSLGFLIVGDATGERVLTTLFGWDVLLPVQVIGEILLGLAALLTLITGYDYLRVGLAHILEGDRAR
ncbi:MAG: CDP-diacylglycerol--glycerol-3-phosphate 3-phosphatidyltransferase [Alphaproteobacteria bacterium RIFOXYD12_FULL_60_8]|nr:MAG: CDP-diacylglycerol--glycerol-3-phosphate 3-phosphatidyltransferase [Alphaproteobacteria bacterium RIFOXYD12_FULL_60_8]